MQPDEIAILIEGKCKEIDELSEAISLLSIPTRQRIITKEIRDLLDRLKPPGPDAELPESSRASHSS